MPVGVAGLREAVEQHDEVAVGWAGRPCIEGHVPDGDFDLAKRGVLLGSGFAGGVGTAGGQQRRGRQAQ